MNNYFFVFFTCFSIIFTIQGKIIKKQFNIPLKKKTTFKYQFNNRLINKNPKSFKISHDYLNLSEKSSQHKTSYRPDKGNEIDYLVDFTALQNRMIEPKKGGAQINRKIHKSKTSKNQNKKSNNKKKGEKIENEQNNDQSKSQDTQNKPKTPYGQQNKDSQKSEPKESPNQENSTEQEESNQSKEKPKSDPAVEKKEDSSKDKKEKTVRDKDGILRPVDCKLEGRHGFTPEQITGLVKAHNELRAKLANGLEDGNPDNKENGNLPMAANINEVIWDTDLQKLAQKFADTCPLLGHSPDLYLKKFGDERLGESKYGAWGGHPFEPMDPVKGWYSEVKGFLKKNTDNMDGERYKGMITGHFFQTVQDHILKIGCGMSEFMDPEKEMLFLSVVCNYFPGKAYGPTPLYITAKEKPCEACKECSQTYPGLCKNNETPE